MTTPYTIVVLVTENNVQATSFQSYLAEQLALPILLVSTLEALPEQDGRESHPLFLVDLDYLKSSQQGGWLVICIAWEIGEFQKRHTGV